MKRAYLVAVGGGALAVAGAAVALLNGGPRTVTSQETAPVAPVSVTQVVSPRAPECSFEKNEISTYALSLESKAVVHTAALGVPNGKDTQATSASSLQLNMKPVMHDASGTVLLSAYRAIQGAASGDPELNAAFLVRVSNACEITGFARLGSVALGTARTQQAILHELLWRFAGSRENFAGENGTGSWTGVLVASADADGPRVQRRINSYTSIWDTKETNVRVDSLLTVRPGKAPWFESLSGSETVATASSDTTTRLEATRIGSNDEALLGVSTDLSQYVWEDLLPKALVKREPRAVTQKDLRDREAVRGLTVEQSLDAYVARVKAGVGIQDTWPPLTAYLEAHPEATAEVIKHLKTDLPAEATQGVYIALGRARTDEARIELLNIKRDTTAPTFERVRAMFSLIDRDDVDVKFAQELKEDSQSLVSPSTRGSSTMGGEALLAVTTMYGLRQEPGVKDVAISAVNEALVNNNSHLTLKPVLSAMANIGDPALLSVARPYMSHPTEKIRADAAIVFRRMPPAESVPTAVEWLQREPSEDVKRRIYETVELQLYDARVKTPMALVRQAGIDLATNPSIIQRKALIRLLGRAEELTPEVRTVLKKQARLELEQKTGLYNSVAAMLSPEDLRAMLEEVAP